MGDGDALRVARASIYYHILTLTLTLTLAQP